MWWAKGRRWLLKQGRACIVLHYAVQTSAPSPCLTHNRSPPPADLNPFAYDEEELEEEERLAAAK